MKALAPEDWPVALDDIKAASGIPPLNVHSLMANHPPLLKAWWNFRNYAVKGGALGQKRGEMVILRVAIRLKSWYEWASHVDRGLQCGLTLDDIEAVRTFPQNNHWSHADAAILTACDELIDQQKISPATQQAFSAHFSNAQMLDLIAIHGMYQILAAMLAAADVPLDEKVAVRLPDGVSQDSFLNGIKDKSLTHNSDGV